MKPTLSLFWTRKNWLTLITMVVLGLTPTIGYPTAAKLSAADLLTSDKGKLSNAPKTTVFYQDIIGGGVDSTVVQQLMLAYFTSTDCTGAALGNGVTSTGSAHPFTIPVSNTFGLIATSAYTFGVGAHGHGAQVPDITLVQSIAVYLLSTTSNVPQAAFNSGADSFYCVNVDCTDGSSCTPVTPGIQHFTLKTTPAIGDPADDGLIGCSTALGDPIDLIVTPANSVNVWDPSGFGNFIDIPNASDTDNGQANTLSIYNCLTLGTEFGGGTDCNAYSYAASTYAAGACYTYTPTGGVTGWYMPAQNELNCMMNPDLDRSALNLTPFFWSSTEFGAPNAVLVLGYNSSEIAGKENSAFYRCTHSMSG